MNGRRRRALVLSTAGAVAIFVGLFVVVGARPVLETLTAAEPTFVAASVAFSLCWLAAWGLTLRRVLATFDVHVPVAKSVFVYAGAVFANNVTPFGQAGGEPIAALLISRSSDARYETGLAGIASLDVVNVITSVSIVVLAVAYHATTTALGERLRTAVGSAIGLVAALVLLGFVVWRFRRRITERVATGIAPRVARLRPGGVDATAVEKNVRGRMRRFFGHLRTVVTDRRGLVVVLGLSALGWLLQAGALFAAFAAIGHDGVALYVLAFVVPLGNLAGAAPLPGGLGGIEAALVALLVPTTGIAAPAVTAAVLIYRGAIYWLPTLVGGGSVAVAGIRTAG